MTQIGGNPSSESIPAVRQFDTRPLAAERIAQAFPLVQTSLPEVTLEAWCDFATALLSGGGPGDISQGGILAVMDARDTIAGLCAYHVVPDLVHGRLLAVEHFLAFDLLDRRAVAHALAQAVEILARERRCGAIHTSLPRAANADPVNGGGLLEVLSTRGHRVESLGLCKRLSA